jgi:hypothetical protein
VNSPEDGPVGPKHVEIRRNMNKIKIVTFVGFFSLVRDVVHKKSNSNTGLVAFGVSGMLRLQNS